MTDNSAIETGVYTYKWIHYNPDCWITSTTLAGIVYIASRYTMVVQKNLRVILPTVWILSYIIMGWYKELYQCAGQFHAGSYGIKAMIDMPFKPQKEGLGVIPDQELIYQRYVRFFHIIMVVPSLVYVGRKIVKKEPIEESAGVYVLVLAGVALAYHTMRLVSPRQSCNVWVSGK